MRPTALTLTAGALVLGLAFLSQPGTHSRQPVMIEGSKDHPILLGRMVVSATALPDRAG